MSINPGQEVVYTPERHSFFNDLATMVFSLYCYMFTRSAFQIINTAGMPGQHRPAEQILKDIRRPLQYSGHYIFLDMNSSDDTFAFPTLWLQTPINADGLLTFIEAYRLPKSDVVQGQGIAPRSKLPMYERIVGASFVSYYSSQESVITAKYGEHENWSDVAHFARVIRNGFAHGGRLEIRGKTSRSWNKWTYDPSDDDKEFFMTPAGLAIGDIILLFKDLHRDLYS